MANIRLTERTDGTIYLQCKCGEIGQRCNYQADVAFGAPGLNPMRQARLEAFEHCWATHRIPAYRVDFEISNNAAEIPSASTILPVSELVSEFVAQSEKPTGPGPQLVREKKTA